MNIVEIMFNHHREHADFHAAKHTCEMKKERYDIPERKMCYFCVENADCEERHVVYCFRHMWE